MFTMDWNQCSGWSGIRSVDKTVAQKSMSRYECPGMNDAAHEKAPMLRLRQQKTIRGRPLQDAAVFSDGGPERCFGAVLLTS